MANKSVVHQQGYTEYHFNKRNNMIPCNDIKLTGVKHTIHTPPIYKQHNNIHFEAHFEKESSKCRGGSNKVKNTN